MLKDQFDHIQINVTNLRRSEKFYESVLGWLGYEKIVDNGDAEDTGIVQWHLGGSRLILAQSRKEFLDRGYHRKHVGLNHLSFWAPTRQVVDGSTGRFFCRTRSRCSTMDRRNIQTTRTDTTPYTSRIRTG
jgi:catechol 2,3-dioxygenase-like lactoylglutathione lyase family enzyme